MNKLDKDNLNRDYNDMMADGLEYSYSNWITSYVQKLGHKYVEKRRKGAYKCLEIGCGTGEYLNQFNGGHYIGIDASSSAIEVAKKRYSDREFICGDIHTLPFENGSIDCIISNYVFEHVRNLDKLMVELNRVLVPKGKLLVSLPTEGGFAWDIGRRLTSKRYMEKKYKIDYMELIRQEHVNTCNGVIRVLKKYFDILHRQYLPFYIPSVHLNAVVGLECRKF